MHWPFGTERLPSEGIPVPADRARKCMKPHSKKAVEQPLPFTPGITKADVRQHALELFRDKLTHRSLSIEDWVLAEKDLVNSLEADNMPK